MKLRTSVSLSESQKKTGQNYFHFGFVYVLQQRNRVSGIQFQSCTGSLLLFTIS